MALQTEPTTARPGRAGAGMSLAEQAYQTIRTQVLDLRLLPGQVILLKELGAQLGMSRTPVREAVARLCNEGLLQKLSRNRMVVTIPTVEAMRETYEIIAGIEGQAAKLAAERADEPMIQRLEEAVAAQESALAKDDFPAWHQADTLFHDLLLRATGNQRMRDVMHLFDAQLYRVRLAAMRLRPKPVQSVKDHRALVEAIRVRNGEEARRIHLDHRERAENEMEQLYSEFLTFVLQLQIVSQSAPARLQFESQNIAQSTARPA